MIIPAGLLLLILLFGRAKVEAPSTRVPSMRARALTRSPVANPCAPPTPLTWKYGITKLAASTDEGETRTQQNQQDLVSHSYPKNAYMHRHLDMTPTQGVRSTMCTHNEQTTDFAAPNI